MGVAEELNEPISIHDAPMGTVVASDAPNNQPSSKQIQNLSQLLVEASVRGGKLVFHGNGLDDEESELSYAELLDDAKQKSKSLSSIPTVSPSSIVLLHFDNQLESITWFWAVTLAGLTPAISTPLVNDNVQRKKHLNHLEHLLQNPIILTKSKLFPEFLDIESLQLFAVDELGAIEATDDKITAENALQTKGAEDIAVLMLTSGSTGNAKAVPLRHGQMLTALDGKSKYHGTGPDDVFLNWINLDHVACLTEVHLHAMRLCSDQIHVPAARLHQDPLLFLRLIDAHRISYTFAPNFFLARLSESLSSPPNSLDLDLSCLKALISGGESNVVATCDLLTQQLRRLGANGEMIRPGFGMTETCAGSIYSTSCPSYDNLRNTEFANLGRCIPGLQMRIMTDSSEPAETGQLGHLQVSGPILYTGYFNHDSNSKVFTSDGYFVTGDIACIDENGHLHLRGRSNDSIVINGVKWSSTEIENAIEESGTPGVIPTLVAAFPHRPTASATEDVCVVYGPAFEPNDDQARYETQRAIIRTTALIIGQRPRHVVPLPPEHWEKSSLGKVSRTKMRTAFENGNYQEFQQQNDSALQQHSSFEQQQPKTEFQKALQDLLSSLLGLPTEQIGLGSSIFDLGMTSLDLISLQGQIQKMPDVDVELPFSALLLDPTINGISAALDSARSENVTYNPIVPLQPHGSKTPLFFIHPGSGDILVFIAVAAYFPTRPVYAIRTRGYNPGERLFGGMDEIAKTYAQHIRHTQPEGPYAIAGYSLGSTLAYEVGKELESQGQQVKFLASIDYPPHIQHFVRDLNWNDVLLHIAFFLVLIDEATMIRITPHVRTLDREAALSYILEEGDEKQMEVLGLNRNKVGLISDIAENFRTFVAQYDPQGKVAGMDVFVADPPTYAADSRQEWREKHLRRWAEFSHEYPEFHECPGIHAKMLNTEHVAAFAGILKSALKKRGV